MTETKIEWADAVWNPVRGCTKVSPGCKNCYAETFAERWRGIKGHPYEQGFDLRLVSEKLAWPTRWRGSKKADSEKRRSRVFVNSMSDLFNYDVPLDFIDRAFAAMALAGEHDFLVLTKRARAMQKYMTDPGAPRRIADHLADYTDSPCIAHAMEQLSDRDPEAWPLPNVWLGVSVEDEERAQQRIPELLATPAAVRWISAEPLLSPVELWRSVPCGYYCNPDADGGGHHDHGPNGRLGSLGWVVVGGESGPGARPFDVSWARSIVEECRYGNIPVFVKQLGARPMLDGVPMLGYLGRGQKGGEMSLWPEDLRVRQFPSMAVPA